MMLKIPPQPCQKARWLDIPAKCYRQIVSHILLSIFLLSAIVPINTILAERDAQGVGLAQPSVPTWIHLSTEWGDLATPGASTQQTASLVLDIDNDNLQDFVIASRRDPGPSLVWYRRTATGWQKYLIEPDVLRIEAGGAYHDIDADGDLDIVMGGDRRAKEIWWWENPFPNFDPDSGWQRHLIKASGAPKHHDQLFGDFDGDGQAELVFWNQHASELILAEIPANPRESTAWPLTTIYRYSGLEHEGLAKADINNDGLLDIVGGGRWFHYRNGSFHPNVIDDSQRFTRVAVGQLKAGGRPEVVFGCGDCSGPLRWYEWDGTAWIAHELFDVPVDHGHTLDVVDINQDGFLDIFVAEMRGQSDNTDAKLLFLLGDGTGNFHEAHVATGFENHENRVADLDGDGDLDILGKPYNWETPRLDIWLNQSICTPESLATLPQWRRHVIDAKRPWRAIFIDSADVDGDGDADIVTGGWWYKNPGIPAYEWERHPFGEQLQNMALVHDLDGDGDVDVLGTAGRGSKANTDFAWAQNDGMGNFAIHENIAAGDGDFLQGVTVLAGVNEGRDAIVLSWHAESKPLQLLTIPAAPVVDEWSIRPLSATSQAEEITAADIDRDGDEDLMLGTQWLRNEGDGVDWTAFTLAPDTMPDRHRLADLNGDGRLDVVVGFEGIGVPAKVAWYVQPTDPTLPWPEEVIDRPIGPMSLDLRDMDDDGDQDVIVGEHIPDDPATAELYIYENLDEQGGAWQRHLVHRGDEHHDGAQTVDIDGDGDQDIISIGWKHEQVLLYENFQPTCATSPSPTNTPLPTATPASTGSSTATSSATATGTTTPAATITTAPPGSTATATPRAAASRTPIATATVTPTATPTPTQAANLPTIEQQPQNLTVRYGDEATFQVVVAGLDPLSYQWHRNDTMIPNATAAAYTLPAVTTADHGATFYCVITNDLGSTTSDPVTLRVDGELTRAEYLIYMPYIVAAVQE